MAVIVGGDEARFATLALVGELIEEVSSCGELRLHRDDARRRTVAEVSVQVVKRAPLGQCRGLRPGRRQRGSLLSGSTAALVRVDKGS